MNPANPDPLPVPAEPPAAHPRPGLASRIRHQLYRAALGAWKFLFGVLLTQSLAGSILIVGWVMRAAQRSVRQAWWRRRPQPEGACFCEFTQGSAFHRALGGWPNWVLEHNRTWRHAHRAPGFGKIRAVFRALFLSLGQNLKLGVQGILNTWVLTLPGCVLMLFSWYAGWHNSFNKGYEQAAIGPATGLAGIALFIAAMFYLPMAQLRQASTGDWRAFYQFRVVWRLIRKRWLMCTGLAMLYTAVSVPVTLLKTMPEFFPQISPRLADLPAPEALRFAKAYYFYAAFAVLAGYVLLRLAAARVYAGALLSCIQSGALPHEALAESEWETLHRLGLLQVRPAPERHVLVRTLAWLGTRLGRAVTGFILFLVWFSFTAQIYISEFMLKSPGGHGWLNQPLVQLPWFNYIPKALRENARSESHPPPVDAAPPL